EGDLGVYINAENVKKYLEEESVGVDLHHLKPLPGSDDEVYLSLTLTDKAVKTAVERHAGHIIEVFGPEGRKTYIKGKDLTAIKYIIGTGGALTRLKNARSILENIRINQVYKKLLPLQNSSVLIDTNYILSSCGTMVDYYKEDAVKLALQSIERSLEI
nr:glutamate mutase L [Exilispira sp.]